MTRTVVALAGLAILATGCNLDPITETPSGPDASAATAALGPGERRFLNYDDELATLSTRIPGFAGIFVDSTGALTVSIARGTPAAQGIEHAATAFLATHASMMQGPARRRPGVRIVEAKYDFATLARFAGILRSRVYREGLNYFDLNEADNVLEIGVADPATAERITARLQSLGFPPDMIRFRMGRATNVAAGGDIRERTTLAGGVHIASEVPGSTTALQGHCSLGFTFQLRDPQTGQWADDYLYGVTAEHCSVIRGPDTRRWYQGGPNRYIGVENVVNSPYTGGECPTGHTCINDAMVLRMLDPFSGQVSDSARGTIAFPIPEEFIFYYATFGKVVGLSDGTGSGALGSVGHTSGRRETSGIRHSCVTTTTEGHPYTYVCVDEVNFRSRAGDSGGPLYQATETPGQVKLVGIVSAAYDDRWWNLTGHHFIHTTMYTRVDRALQQTRDVYGSFELVTNFDETKLNKPCRPHTEGFPDITCAPSTGEGGTDCDSTTDPNCICDSAGECCTLDSPDCCDPNDPNCGPVDGSRRLRRKELAMPTGRPVVARTGRPKQAVPPAKPVAGKPPR